MSTTKHQEKPVAVPGTRCERCDDSVSAAEVADAHWLAPDEATEWGAKVGFYHEGCCPECNGLSPDLPPFADFTSAARSVLAHLHERLGFDLWMVARVQGRKFVVLAALDHGYGVEVGSVFRWTDTFCSRMVAGEGPRIAPDASMVRAYAEAQINGQLRIGAYLGVPLHGADGTLIGTLCAVHPRSLPAAIRNDQPLVELQARLLSSLLVRDGVGTAA